ncbi:MAG TPA: YoaK family protein [Candidatus Elarobacter sp.]|nr:YoaK family protein [Candidatus Elarobacter sp.]
MRPPETTSRKVLIPPPREGGFRAELAAIPLTFIVLTTASGMVDAVTFLTMGHVFVANMTGNVVFLGFAAAGDRDISAAGSLAALAAFVLGSFAGGALTVGSSRAERLMLRATSINLVLALGALAVVAMLGIAVDSPGAFAAIVLLAIAMGIQSAVARTIAVPDFTTTVLTMTITGLAADLARGVSPKTLRRLLSVAAMFAGAAVGAVLVLRLGVPAGLIGVCAVLALSIGVELRTLRSLQEPAASAR